MEKFVFHQPHMMPSIYPRIFIVNEEWQLGHILKNCENLKGAHN
jgi:hypothetical protein